MDIEDSTNQKVLPKLTVFGSSALFAFPIGGLVCLCVLGPLNQANMVPVTVAILLFSFLCFGISWLVIRKSIRFQCPKCDGRTLGIFGFIDSRLTCTNPRCAFSCGFKWRC
jgi:hypothetical protein